MRPEHAVYNARTYPNPIVPSPSLSTSTCTKSPNPQKQQPRPTKPPLPDPQNQTKPLHTRSTNPQINGHQVRSLSPSPIHPLPQTLNQPHTHTQSDPCFVPSQSSTAYKHGVKRLCAEPGFVCNVTSRHVRRFLFVLFVCFSSKPT